ncbi:MAG: LacI family DNA-binding transcriptional regulator [Anaerolineales bacterium]|nr:LacI family DNA-binding transcriptional regulator [Anaerolineales bacterium]
MKKKQRRVTSTDVARESGVSRATVSYVLNNDQRQTISPETRERVLKAVQKLGYQPFAPARILRTGYSNLVLAVIQFEQIDPNIARDLKYLEAGLNEQGFTLICYVGWHNRQSSTHPSTNLTPAVIVSFVDARDPAEAAFLQQFNVPVLSLNNSDSGKSVGKTQVTYLVQRGQQRIVFATTERHDVQRLAQARLNGVRQRCAELGLRPPLVQVIPSSREGSREAIAYVLAHQSPPFGICCYNDEVAFSVIAALSKSDIMVPESVAVIGCDDIPLAQFSIPSLTTIGFQNRNFLDLLIENILAASRGESIKELPPLSLSIIMRESA